MSVVEPSEKPDLALVLDGIPQAVLVVDRTYSISFANMFAEQLFHASEAYLLKHRLDELLPQDSSVLQLVGQVFAHQSPVNEYRVTISSTRIRQDKIVDIYAAPMSNNSDLAILTFRERGVTDRIDRQLDYRGGARAVTGLAAMLGHEIKNPLSGIRGAAQLLGSVVSDEDKTLADLITTETDRIVKIVDRMEVFSDETPIEREAVNMHSVLGHVRRIAQNGFAERIEITEDYDPSLPYVSGSRDALIQVFLNLIKNSAEALGGRSGGKINLSSAYRSGIRVMTPGAQKRASLQLEFSVSDNGDGIPEELQAHIFEPFVTTRINGSGLGLALVAKTVERHGGIIECSTSVDGTSFRILLPAWEDKPSSLEPVDG